MCEIVYLCESVSVYCPHGDASLKVRELPVPLITIANRATPLTRNLLLTANTSPVATKVSRQESLVYTVFYRSVSLSDT